MVECENIFCTGMYFLPPHRFEAQNVHHCRQINFHRTACHTGLAGEAEPDGVAGKDCGVGCRNFTLQMAEDEAGCEIHLCCGRASGGTFAALITAGNRNGCLVQHNGCKCVCGVVMLECRHMRSRRKNEYDNCRKQESAWGWNHCCLHHLQHCRISGS